MIGGGDVNTTQPTLSKRGLYDVAVVPRSKVSLMKRGANGWAVFYWYVSCFLACFEAELMGYT